MINQVCPKCDSAYLLELSNAKGTFLVCPNNRAELPKRRAKKGAAEAGPMPPECSYKKKIGPPAGAVVPVLEMPDPEKTRAVVESVA
jgi:DNA topoisomerase-1